MSAIFGKEGYRFVEINVVKTIFGATFLIFLLQFFLPIGDLINQLINQSGNILLIILLLVFSRLVGSLIIEIIQEVIVLPILKGILPLVVEHNNYLKLFPPYKMWKDALFKKAREEIIILVSLFVSLIMLWATFNTNTLQLSILKPGKENSINGISIDSDLIKFGDSVMINLFEAFTVIFFVNIVFSVLAYAIIYLLYKAVFDSYTDGKREIRSSWIKKNIIILFPLFIHNVLWPIFVIYVYNAGQIQLNLIGFILTLTLLYFLLALLPIGYLLAIRYLFEKPGLLDIPILRVPLNYLLKKSVVKDTVILIIPFLSPLAVPLFIFLTYSYIGNQQILLGLVYLTCISGAALTYLGFLKIYFSPKEERRAEDIESYERNLENDFRSYYSLYYNLLNYETKNTKLKTQLYLISAIHAFNLLSSHYLYDIQEKAFQGKNTNYTVTTELPDIPNYAIATRVYRIVVENVVKNNFDVAVGFFLSQLSHLEEVAIATIAKSENIDLVIHSFEKDYNWDVRQLLPMLITLNTRGEDPKFSNEIGNIIAKELDNSGKGRADEEFLENIYRMLYHKDSENRVISMDSVLLRSVLRVAKESKSKEKILICVDFWRIFIKKTTLRASTEFE